MTKTHELRLAKRMARLGTETAFEVLVKAKALEAQGKDIVHLEIGEPDFDTPGNVVATGIDALRNGWTHYTPSAGLPALREAIAEEVSRTRNVKCTADEVVVVPGGKPTIYFTFMALVEEGDEVIYPNPGFPIYESMINFLGARPVPLPLREEKDFRLDANELADLITDRTRLIVLNSPHNPTGSVLEPQDLRDDGMAPGLRRDAPGAGQILRAAHDQRQLLHGRLHPGRGDRSAARRPGFGRAHVQRIQAPPRSLRGANQPDPRLQLPGSQGSFLRLPQHAPDPLGIKEDGRGAVGRRRCCLPGRNRVRR